MEFFRSKGIMYKVLFIVAVCLLLSGSNGTENGFKIFRTEHDIFTNLKCTKKLKCTNEQCKSYGAECMDTKCTCCRCMKGRSTFMTSQDDASNGACQSDEELVSESVPKGRFWLKNNNTKECLKPVRRGSENYIIGTNCTKPTLDMLWIWTKGSDKKLMNVRTLQCMKRHKNGGNVTMEPCRKSFDRQKLKCEQYGSEMKIEWKRENNPSHKYWVYLHFARKNTRSVLISNQGKPQLWSSNKTYSCETEGRYKGCYRFSDGSFMKYVNYSKRSLEVRISAPIFRKNRVCEVEETFEFIRDGEEWKTSNEGNIFSIEKYDSSVKEIKIAKKEHFEAWNGTLLKLSIKCGNNEQHCVLLKLQSLPGYNRKSTNAAIVVTVILLAVLLLLALGYLLYYRRRKRARVP